MKLILEVHPEPRGQYEHYQVMVNRFWLQVLQRRITVAVDEFRGLYDLALNQQARM